MTQTQIIPLRETQPGDCVTISFPVKHYDSNDPHWVSYINSENGESYVRVQDFVEAPDAKCAITREVGLPDVRGMVFMAYMPNLLRDVIVEAMGCGLYYVTSSSIPYYERDFDATTVRILYDPSEDVADRA